MRRTNHKSLFWKDINNLYKALKDFEYEDNVNIEEYLVEGVELAKNLLLSADGASEVADSIDYMLYSDGSGQIFINGNSEIQMLSIYMEYGTGVTGQYNPHRYLSSENYDLNEHGIEGWVYYNTKLGKFMRTTGMIPKSYMYKTYLYLRRKILNTDSKLRIEFIVGDESTPPSISIRRLRDYHRKSI